MQNDVTKSCGIFDLIMSYLKFSLLQCFFKLALSKWRGTPTCQGPLKKIGLDFVLVLGCKIVPSVATHKVNTLYTFTFYARPKGRACFLRVVDENPFPLRKFCIVCEVVKPIKI